MRHSGPSLFLLFAACTGDVETDGPEVTRTRLGDTTVVRTLAGTAWPERMEWRRDLSIGELDGPPETTFGRLVSVAVRDDGSILAVDRQVPTVRVFSDRGEYLESWGRQGQGPGELQAPDAGLAILHDGRVVVRDRGNARLQVYASTGEALDTWPVITGQYINRRAFGVTGDTLLNPDVINPADPLPEWRLGLVRILADGTVLDTLPIPDAGRGVHRFIVRNEGNTAEVDLPFGAGEHWAWHPDGFVIHGVGDDYAVTLYREGRPLRIERQFTPVPVTDGERQQEEQRVLNAMRWLDPGWRWTGPRIPDTKPAFSGIVAGLDGRVWLMRDGPAYEVEDPDYDPSDPYDTEIRWRQDRLLDGFDADGDFLGSTVLPRNLDSRVPFVLKEDFMWAVIRDELGVQRIARFRLEPRAEPN